MNNIVSIEINIKGLTQENIIIRDGKCIKNGIEFNITTEKILELIRLIRTWKEEYGCDNKLDSEEFKVTLIEKEVYTFHGKGVFPENYSNFKEWLGGLDA